ncbi:MAG: hypothetical protein R2795_00650 [Saprospiraceae bacterium]
MNYPIITVAGLVLIATSQLLMSFGFDFLMAQRPIDYAHWALLLGAIFMLSLWRSLPKNMTKTVGLMLMTLGVGGIIGMCTLDFILWASHGDPDVKREIFAIISNQPPIKYPFLLIGPTLFYAGICIATYGLFSRFKWQVLVINLGTPLIGLGHLVLNNQVVPVIGAILLLVGMFFVLDFGRKTDLKYV